jgi:hypothetical protein
MARRPGRRLRRRRLRYRRRLSGAEVEELRKNAPPPSYERERAQEVMHAISSLWGATDYPEAHLISNYTEEELKAFLGQWIHIRNACDEIFAAIRAAHPELPGWAPIQGEKPIE